MFVFKAAVVGAGTMGGEVAQVIASAGIPVMLKDVGQEYVDLGLRKAGLLRLLVLHLLGQGPSYGNQLMERVGELTGGLVGVNPNTMYPLLRALEAEGIVAGEWEHPERRSRRFYRLTEAGEGERDALLVDLGPRLDELAVVVDLLRGELLG